MKFELTYANGETELVQTGEIADAARLATKNTNILKIEEIDSTELKRNKKILGKDLSELGRKYLPANVLAFELIQIVRKSGFTLDYDSFNITGTDGIKTVDIGRGTYLHFTWYKMPNGKYEFVGYLTT